MPAGVVDVTVPSFTALVVVPDDRSASIAVLASLQSRQGRWL
jgi:hypothetical protein